MTTDQWVLVVSIAAAVVVVLLIAWFAFGVWYTEHRGPGRAKTRWIVYNRTRRRLYARQMAKLNPPTMLQVDDMTLDLALDYDARARRRRKHEQTDT